MNAEKEGERGESAQFHFQYQKAGPVKSENESKGARERGHESGRESSGERWGALWQWQAGARVRAGPSAWNHLMMMGSMGVKMAVLYTA